MKKTIYIAFAAIGLLSIASCQDEYRIPDPIEEPAARVITAAFDNNITKTTPSVGQDQTTPLWAVGDVFRLLDASDTSDETVHYQDITLTEEMISSDKTVITFTTTLKGATLYAVYPKAATDMTSCNGDVTFKIPEEQDGSFAKANISVAKADNDHLIFCNATAVLEFTQTAATTAVKRVQVRAANPISGTLTATFGTDNKVNNVTLTTPRTHTIVATTPSDAKDTYYIAVAPVATGAIEFKYNKGLVAYPDNVAVYSDAAGRTLVRNKIYRGSNLSMDGKEYGIDYVNITASYDGANQTPLKWAVENVAISPSGKKAWKGNGTESLWHVVGDYFQWAAHAGYCGNATDSDKGLLIYESFNNSGCGDAGDAFEFKSAGNGKNYWFSIFNSNDGAYNFISPYCPVVGHYQHDSQLDIDVECAEYSEYNSTSATLSTSDDVARIIYGSDWRMPKYEDFEALVGATYWAWDATDMGYYVFNPTSSHSAGTYSDTGIPSDLFKIDALLFFPAAGYADGSDLHSAGANGDYWSSSPGSVVFEDQPNNKSYIQSACGLDILPETYIQQYHTTVGGRSTMDDLNRYLGFSVRPVGVVTANNPDPTETDPEETVL